MERSASISRRDYEVTLPPQSVPFHVLHEAVQREAQNRENLEMKNCGSSSCSAEPNMKTYPYNELPTGAAQGCNTRKDASCFSENGGSWYASHSDLQQTTPRMSSQYQNSENSEAKHPYYNQAAQPPTHKIPMATSSQYCYPHDSTPQGSHGETFPLSPQHPTAPEHPFDNTGPRQYSSPCHQWQPAPCRIDEKLTTASSMNRRHCSNQHRDYTSDPMNGNDHYAFSRKDQCTPRDLRVSPQNCDTYSERKINNNNHHNKNPYVQDHIDQPVHPCSTSSTTATDSCTENGPRDYLQTKHSPQYSTRYVTKKDTHLLPSPKGSHCLSDHIVKPRYTGDAIISPIRRESEEKVSYSNNADWCRKSYLYTPTPYKCLGSPKNTNQVSQKICTISQPHLRMPFYKFFPVDYHHSFSYVTNSCGLVPSYVAVVSHPLVDSYGLLEFILEDERMTHGPLMAVEFISIQKVNCDPRSLNNMVTCTRAFEKMVRQTAVPALVIDGFFDTLERWEMVLNLLGQPQLVLILSMPHRHVFRQLCMLKKCYTEDTLDKISQNVFIFDNTLPEIVSHIKSKASIKMIEFTKQPLIPLATEVKNVLIKFLVRAG